MTRTLSGCLAAVVVLLTLVPQVAAQDYGRLEDTRASAPGYFFFARPGEPTVSVTAVGAVGATGRYLLGAGSTVADLVALSGGVRVPTPASTDGLDLVEPVEPIVRLLRGGTLVSESTYRDLFGSAASPERLRDGDVVEVEIPQQATDTVVSTARGYFVHARPGRSTVVATVVGAVAAPGRYVLEDGADVTDLLALSGGASLGERDASVRVNATVTVYRGSDISFTTPLESLYTQTTPALADGDIVELSVVTRRRSSFTWRDGLSLVTTALAIVIAVDRLSN